MRRSLITVNGKNLRSKGKLGERKACSRSSWRLFIKMMVKLVHKFWPDATINIFDGTTIFQGFDNKFFSIKIPIRIKKEKWAKKPR